MTTAPALQLDRHPLAPVLRPGDIVWTWCSQSGDRERHIYRPGTIKPLTCLHCHPELDPEKEGEK